MEFEKFTHNLRYATVDQYRVMSREIIFLKKSFKIEAAKTPASFLSVAKGWCGWFGG